jgi:cytochrome c oxidase cbb3-type subunit 2
MTLKTFLAGIVLTFGLAWVTMIAIPVANMGKRPPVKMSDAKDAPYYQHFVSGRLLNGAEIYHNNGCANCHTQIVRPTHAGNDVLRKHPTPPNDSAPFRETAVNDFDGEAFANIGRQRIGPDLSNFGIRAETYATKTKMSPEQWVIEHLNNPRNGNLHLDAAGKPTDMSWSNCPAQHQMFERVNPQAQPGGFTVTRNDSEVYQPAEDARTLTSYLLSLKRNETLPPALSHHPEPTE